MSTFPKLKSGAIAQYPISQSKLARTWIGSFLDGTEQRFRLMGEVKRKWILDLGLLCEAEVTSIQELWQEVDGPIGTFSFECPFDGNVYAECGFGGSELKFTWDFDARAKARIVIEQRN